MDLAARSARVTVPDYQLSLAIGKEGQNARLAARLTGWRIDIRPDTEQAAGRTETAGAARIGTGNQSGRRSGSDTTTTVRSCPEGVRSVRGGRLKRVWPDACPRMP